MLATAEELGISLGGTTAQNVQHADSGSREPAYRSNGFSRPTQFELGKPSSQSRS